MASAAPPKAAPSPPPTPPPPPRPRELLLLGGGHAHVEVLRQLPTFDPRVRITLVARELLAPYSGMLPGVVAGVYSAREAQIDVAALCGGGPRCRVVRGEARAVDVPGRRVLVRKEGEKDESDWMPYDLLSINVGIEPAAAEGGGGIGSGVTPVKPISSFLARWEQEVLPQARAALAARAEEQEGQGTDLTLFRVAVVGGGAGGVELAFAVAQRLWGEWEGAWRRRRRRPSSSSSSSPDLPPPPAPARVTLYSRGPILPDTPPAARAKILALASPEKSLVRIREDGGGVAGVVVVAEGATAGGGSALRLSKSAAAAEKEELLEPFDACLWCTQAAAPSWFLPPQSAGLPLDARGFLRVRPTLQLLASSDDVFAAGDAAAIEGYPRPKAGVYAVRAGPFLAENLRRRAQWLAEAAEASPSSSSPPPPPPALLDFRPQRHALALISAGTKWAIAVRPPFPLCPSGEWAWRWKDRIDRAFVRRYDALAGEARAGEGEGDGGT